MNNERNTDDYNIYLTLKEFSMQPQYCKFIIQFVYTESLRGGEQMIDRHRMTLLLAAYDFKEGLKVCVLRHG